MKNIKISILISSYNYEDYISECIQSCLNQDYKNKEIIIIDDNSLDNSKNIIKDFKLKYPELKVILHDKNIWLRKSLLEWLEIITGDFVCRIDSDDKLLNNKSLSLKVEMINKNPNIAFLYSDFISIDSNWNILPNTFNMYHSKNFIWNDFKNIISWNRIIASWTIINLKYKDYIIDNIWDWDLWLSLSKNFEVWYINEALIAYRIHWKSYIRTFSTQKDDFHKKNQWIYQKDYVFMHWFDSIKTAFKNLPKFQKISIFDKARAFAGCYRFGAFFLLKQKRYLKFAYFLIISLILDPIYYIKNIWKIYYLFFNIKKY